MVDYDRDLQRFNQRVVRGTQGRRSSVAAFIGSSLALMVGILFTLSVAVGVYGAYDDWRHPERVAARRAEEDRTRKLADARRQKVEAAQAAAKTRKDEEQAKMGRLLENTAKARALVDSHLRDPSTAIYGPAFAVANGYGVCGVVNSHNGFGGYSGDTAFIVIGDTVRFAPTEAGLEADSFERLFNDVCRTRTDRVAVPF